MREYIRAEGLNKFYDRHTPREAHVLRNVSLSLPKTGLVTIMGESGSGKTTFINAAGALDTFSSGKIVAGGRELTGRMDKRAEEVRNSIYGYIFQNYYLLYDKTVLENLMLALCLYDIPEEEKIERCDYVLNAVGMYRYRKRKAGMLSGGQQQRVAIARALIKTPEVVFADEPTGNLDEANTMLVMSVLKKLSANCLVVIATHEERIARFFADRIVRIKDGRVVSDEENAHGGAYARADDIDVYLEEYERSRIEAGGLAGDYYSNGEKIELTIVNRAGELFISVPEGVKASFVGVESGVRLVQGKREDVEIEDVSRFEYDLKKLRPKKHGRLTAGQIWALAREGVRSMGKRLILPVAAMLASAVLSIVAVSDYMNVAATNVEDFIRTDSRYLPITVERGDYMSAAELNPAAAAYINGFFDANPGLVIYPLFNIEPQYKNEGFRQVSALSDSFYGYTYAPLSLLDESALIAGRMPERAFEVVADRWLLQNFMDRNTILSASVADVDYFVGQELSLPKKGVTLTICGICDSGEPTMYIDDTAGLGLCLAGTTVASLESLRAEYPGEYDDIELGEGEILLNEARTSYTVETTGKYSTTIGDEYDVLGSFHGEFAASFVISEETYDPLLRSLCVASRSFAVFTEDKAAVRAYLGQGVEDEQAGRLHATLNDRYSEQLASFEAARELKVNARLLVSVMILLLSLAMLYVSMNINVQRNIGSIGVYRLLGIKKSSIAFLFALETLMLSAFTTVTGAAITASALKLVSGIESLGLSFNFTLEAFLVTLAALIAANLIAGLLPIARLLAIPPAKLAEKSTTMA